MKDFKDLSINQCAMPLYVIGVGGLGIGGNIGTLGALGVGIPQQIRYQVFGCSRSLPRRTPKTGN